jgi:hypothetical protein
MKVKLVPKGTAKKPVSGKLVKKKKKASPFRKSYKNIA